MRMTYDEMMGYLSTAGEVAKRSSWDYNDCITMRGDKVVVEKTGEAYTPTEDDKAAQDWVSYALCS